MHDELLGATFHSAPVGMLLVSLDGSLLGANAAACKLLGYAGHEILAHTYEALTCPAYLESDRAATRQLLDREIDVLHIEKQFIHKEQASIWAAVSVFLVKSETGEPRCLFAQLEDISVQKEVELARDTFFQLPLALHFVAGFDGHFKKLSATWTEVLGYPLEHLLSVPYMEFVHPDDRERTANAAQQLSVGQHVFLFENRYRHRDGSYRWLLWVAVSTPDQQTINGVALDYTAKKETELELADTLRKMETLMGELKASHSTIETLREGLVTVCAWTKRIQFEGRWMTIDEFLKDHLHLKLTHGISNEAADQLVASLNFPNHPDQPATP